MDADTLLEAGLTSKQIDVDQLLSLEFPTDPFMRFLVNKQLEMTRDPDAVDLLLTRLTDDNPGVASSAAVALGAIGDGRANEPLRDLLATSHMRDYHQQIDIGAVIEAIRHTSGDVAQTLLDLLRAYPYDSVIAVHVINRLPVGDDPRIITGVLGALTSESGRVADTARDWLARIGRNSPALLVSSVFDRVSPGWLKQNEESLHDLMRTVGPVVVPSLITTAQTTTSQRALRIIVRALFEIHDARAVELYRVLRSHPDPVARTYAIFGLAAAGDQSVTEEVLQRIGQGWSEYEVGQACTGLGASALPALLDMLSDPAMPEDQREDVISVLGVMRQPDAVPALLDALTTGTLDMRRRAARSLGEIRDLRAVTPLINLLHDPQAGMRWTAILALYDLARHQIDTAQITKALVGVMIDRQEEPHEREQAALLLPSLGKEELVPAFKEAFEEQHPKSTAIISGGLARLGQSGIEALIEYAQSGQEPLQTNAFKRLCFVRDPAAERVVIEGLRATSPARRKEAAFAIGRWRLQQGLQPLMSALNDSDEAVQLEAINSLAEIGNVESLYRLIEFRCGLDDKEGDAKYRAVSRALMAIYNRVSASTSAAG